MIHIRYFARLRDQLDTAAEMLDDHPPTLGELAERLAVRGEAWAEAFAGPVLMAVNHEMARPDTVLNDGDEVGFFPPVTGG